MPQKARKMEIKAPPKRWEVCIAKQCYDWFNDARGWRRDAAFQYVRLLYIGIQKNLWRPQHIEDGIQTHNVTNIEQKWHSIRLQVTLMHDAIIWKEYPESKVTKHQEVGQNYIITNI